MSLNPFQTQPQTTASFPQVQPGHIGDSEAYYDVTVALPELSKAEVCALRHLLRHSLHEELNVCIYVSLHDWNRVAEMGIICYTSVLLMIDVYIL